GLAREPGRGRVVEESLGRRRLAVLAGTDEHLLQARARPDTNARRDLVPGDAFVGCVLVELVCARRGVRRVAEAVEGGARLVQVAERGERGEARAGRAHVAQLVDVVAPRRGRWKRAPVVGQTAELEVVELVPPERVERGGLDVEGRAPEAGPP